MFSQIIYFFIPVILTLWSVPKCYGQTEGGPLVETDVGLIRGLRATDGNYSMFMGIRYATVNESNPFGPSIPYPRIEGIFEAYDDTAICPQIEEFNYTIVGTLDCLHINIYVPDSATPLNKRPVLVWIYGGSYMIGFAGRFLYGPKFLVRHDIILVTLNYRVGPYGFMCLDAPEVPGNQGLKDQKMALEWIKNNIEAFGGDADKITIYGMSAGGVSVDLQYTYGDQSLFDKIILHSGTATVPWVIGGSDVTAPLRLAENLGYATDDYNDAISFLSTIDPHEVIASVDFLDMGFGPCIEKEFEGVERFIHDHPFNIQSPDASNKSALLAYNRDENLLGFALLEDEVFQYFNTFHNDLEAFFNFDSEQLQEMEEVIRHFYIGDENFSSNVKYELAEYSSDFHFIHPTVRAIERFLKSGSQNVYSFVFSYDGGRNFAKHRIDAMHIEGATHADDLGYMFDVSYMDEPTPEDQLAIDRMTTLWANFVKYGNPTPEITDLLPVTWQPVTEDIFHYLELDANINVGQRPKHERMTFWNLFYELNREHQVFGTENDVIRRQVHKYFLQQDSNPRRLKLYYSGK